jgi:hypothetical protein
VPGWSSSLPPRRNIFGEAIIPEGALGPDPISPIYRSTEREDPVIDEIRNNRVQLSMPVRYIGGTSPATGVLQVERSADGVPLTPKEYDRYVQLAGTAAKKD